MIDISIRDRNCTENIQCVTGTWRGGLGASFVSVDWRVRVFWCSGLVYRPSERLYVRTIPLAGCMDIWSSYIQFSSQTWLACLRKTCASSASPEELPLYGSPRQGPPGPWKFSDDWTAWGVPQTEKVSSKDWEAYTLSAYSTLITQFQCTQQLQNTVWAGFLNALGDFCWLDLPRWTTAILRD